MFKTATDNDAAVSCLDDFFSISHLRESELFCYLGAYLSGVTVDGLTSAKDNVVVAYLFHCLGKRIGGGKCVGAAKRPVGKHDATICSAIDCFAD